jgi:hypothetical protein
LTGRFIELTCFFMKNIRTYLFLLFIAVSIVASLLAIWENQYFMFVHLAGSFILLAFVLLTMDLKNEGKLNSDWRFVGKIYFVLGWIYNIFLIATFLALSTLFTLQYKNGISLAKTTFISAIAVGIYVFLSISYFRVARRAKNK